MRFRSIAATAGVAAVLLGISAAPALASTHTNVRAVTHTSANADTTGSATGTYCTTSSRGPIWAWDNLSLRFDTAEVSSTTYTVTIEVSGTFTSFTTRECAAPVNENGSVRGYLNETVTSSSAPNPKALPAQESGNVSETTMVDQLFQGGVTGVTTVSYSYTYTQITGERCVTSTSGFTCTKP